MNSECVDLIKQFEGCKLEAYQDQRGIWTIGYGSTSDVHEGMVITQADAELRLEADLAEAKKRLGALVQAALTENQWGALVSLVFNIGSGNFAGSTLRTLLNEAKIADAANEFPKWCRTGGLVNPGLLRRRNLERALFLKA
jgi:lysozyme